MRKSLILLVFLGLLTSCADRTKINCQPVKNKALTISTIENNLGAKCG